MRIARPPVGSCTCLKYDLGFTSLNCLGPDLWKPSPHLSLSYLGHALLCGQSRCVGEGLMVMGGAGLKDSCQKLRKVLGESGLCLVFSLAPSPSDLHFRYP